MFVFDFLFFFHLRVSGEQVETLFMMTMMCSGIRVWPRHHASGVYLARGSGSDESRRAERREGARPSDLPEPLAQSRTGSGSDIGDNRTQSLAMESHSLPGIIEIVCQDVLALVMILLIFCTTSESMNDLDTEYLSTFRLSHHHYRQWKLLIVKL